MAEKFVRIIKFDAGSPTDQTINRMQGKLNASSSVEAMRRSLTIADAITDFVQAGQKIFVQDGEGNLRELVIT